MRFFVECAFPHLRKRGVASRKSAFWSWCLTEKRILAVGRICLLGFRLRPSRKTIWGSWQRERSTKGLSRNNMHCHSAVSVRAGRSGASSNAGRSDLLTRRCRIDIRAPLDRACLGSYRERPSTRGVSLQAGRSFSYRTVSRLVKLMCPMSPSTYRPFYVHLERIVPSASAVQHARAVYAALPRSSLRLSTAPALLSSDGKSSSI